MREWYYAFFNITVPAFFSIAIYDRLFGIPMAFFMPESGEAPGATFQLLFLLNLVVLFLIIAPWFFYLRRISSKEDHLTPAHRMLSAKEIFLMTLAYPVIGVRVMKYLAGRR